MKKINAIYEKKALLEDIAKELNVSKTLVSMVINGKGDKYGISIKTQKKVTDKVGEMEYTPNVFARALRTGKSNLIAILVADISNSFYSNIAKYIEKELAKKGYKLIICNTDENIQREENLISLFAEQQMVDALIIASASTSGEFFKRDKLKNFPIVFIDRYLPDIKSNYVVANNYQGSYEITDLLINKGCENIIVFNISHSYISSLTERLNGYKDALKKHKLPFKKGNVIEISFYNIEKDIRDNLKIILKNGAKIDAIYAFNNNIATTCLNVFKELNINLEKQSIYFASFDDLSIFNFIKLPIISVSQPLEQIGFETAKLAIKLIDAKGSKNMEIEKIVLPTSIIERN